MQGIGFACLIAAYAIFYAAAQQTAGRGGSVLYWMTGDTRLGAPAQDAPGSTGGNPSSGGSGPSAPDLAAAQHSGGKGAGVVGLGRGTP